MSRSRFMMPLALIVLASALPAAAEVLTWSADAPFPDNPFCYGYGYTLPVIDHLDLIVTCAQIVDVVPTAWGSVQALYR